MAHYEPLKTESISFYGRKNTVFASFTDQKKDRKTVPVLIDLGDF